MVETTYAGYVAIVGRPNVGKSTLLNRILRQKISITSRKPQTTRHQIMGIHTHDQHQVIYVDTPGLHREEKRAINRVMNRAASSVLADVDVVVFIVDGLQWTEADEWVLSHFKDLHCPVILGINKIDKIKDKKRLLPHIAFLHEQFAFTEVIPFSAKNSEQVAMIESAVEVQLPENVHIFPEDQVTDRSEKFLVAEIVREKLMRALGQELPYALTVEIELYREEEKRTHVAAVIWVERSGQKAIVIGKDGGVLKSVGTQARQDMQVLLGRKVFLELWVKVKDAWSNDERALQQFGYID